jgi:hypothetical protein
MTRMTRFGRCAITTRSDGVRALPSLPSLAKPNHKRECLVAFPIPIIRNSQRIEDVSLKEQETITVQKMPRNINTKMLTISSFLFRCFGSLNPNQVSSRPCANQYILSNAALLKDPTCAPSRENLFHSLQGILHKHILEKRSYFIVHALRAFHRSGRRLKQ